VSQRSWLKKAEFSMETCKSFVKGPYLYLPLMNRCDDMTLIQGMSSHAQADLTSKRHDFRIEMTTLPRSLDSIGIPIFRGGLASLLELYL